MYTIDNFTGGQNTRKAPHLIDAGESQVLINADLDKGTLLSVHEGLGNADQPAKAWYSSLLDKFMPSAQERDYVSFGVNVYATAKEGAAVKWRLPNPSLFDGGPNSQASLQFTKLGLGKPLEAPHALVTPMHDHTLNAFPAFFAGVHKKGTYFKADGVLYKRKVLFESYASVLNNLGAHVSGGSNEYSSTRSYKAGDYTYLNINAGRVDTNGDALPPNWLIFRFEKDSQNPQVAPLISGGFVKVVDPVDWVTLYTPNNRYNKGDILSVNSTAYLVTKSGTFWGHYPNQLESVDPEVGSAHPLDVAETLKIGLEKGWIEEDKNVVRKLQYVQTFYNSVDGTESPPSDLSNEVELPTKETKIGIGLTLASFLPSDGALADQATHIRVYRVGAGSSTFRRVAEIARTSASALEAPTHHDTKEVDDPTIIRSLTSQDNQPPVTGLRYLTVIKGVFFGSFEEKLYFSKVGNPNYWPASNYIRANAPITSLVATASGLVVFTEQTTSLLQGDNAKTFDLRLLHATKGCINHKATCPVGAGAVFVGSAGLYVVTGAGVRDVAAHALPLQTFDSVNAVVLNDRYYLLLADRSVLTIFNNDGGVRVVRLSGGYDWLYLKKGQVRANAGGFNVDLFTSTDRLPLTYVSKRFGSPLTVLKTHTKVLVSCTGKLTLDVFIDGTQVVTKVLKGSRLPESVLIPSTRQIGTNISFGIKGIGEVMAISFDQKSVS